MVDDTDTDRAWKELLELMRKFVSMRHDEAQRTLLVKIHHENYPISCEVLNQVFSRFGVIEKLEKSSPELGFHSKVCFKNAESALMALNSINGKHIYDGCCRLELSISDYTRDQSSEIEAPIEGMRQVEPAISEPEIFAQDSRIEVDEDRAIQFESSTTQLTETEMDYVESLRGSTEHQIEDSHQQTEAHENQFVMVAKQPFADAYHLFDEMPMEDESEILQENFGIHREHNNSNNSMKQITSSSTTTTSKVEALSPSTEKKISEFKEGNSKYSELHLIDLDGNERSNWMRNCEEWESRALVGYLSYRNLDMQPLDVDDNVGTRRIESMMMKQHLVSAHEVFERMSEKEMVDVEDFIGLLHTLRDVFGLIEFYSSFVFDPGKGLELSSHIKRVESTLVFDPGGNLLLCAYRRTHGLCYKCGDKYFVGHQCKTSSLHSLMSSEIDDVCPAYCTELITTAVRDEAQQKFGNEI